MKILSFETSAKTVSAAVTENGAILAFGYLNRGFTHSETLLPLAEGILSAAKLSLEEIDAFAVCKGPGSFTGLRIGISTVKGLCQGTKKPCIGVSTLEGIAYNYRGLSAVVAAVMDARRNQFYSALFSVDRGDPVRLSEDAPRSMEELRREIAGIKQPVTLVGDGALLCYEQLKTTGDVLLAPPQLQFQNAASVGFAAEKYPAIPCEELMPSYLRLSQAERERLAKEKG